MAILFYPNVIPRWEGNLRILPLSLPTNYYTNLSQGTQSLIFLLLTFQDRWIPFSPTPCLAPHLLTCNTLFTEEIHTELVATVSLGGAR